MLSRLFELPARGSGATSLRPPSARTPAASTPERCGSSASIAVAGYRQTAGDRGQALHPAKTHVAATSAPATFLGFELRPGCSSCSLSVSWSRCASPGGTDQHGHPTEFRRGGGGITS